MIFVIYVNAVAVTVALINNTRTWILVPAGLKGTGLVGIERPVTFVMGPGREWCLIF